VAPPAINETTLAKWNPMRADFINERRQPAQRFDAQADENIPKKKMGRCAHSFAPAPGGATALLNSHPQTAAGGPASGRIPEHPRLMLPEG
jgi:hypothetical protein